VQRGQDLEKKAGQRSMSKCSRNSENREQKEQNPTPLAQAVTEKINRKPKYSLIL